MPGNHVIFYLYNISVTEYYIIYFRGKCALNKIHKYQLLAENNLVHLQLATLESDYANVKYPIILQILNSSLNPVIKNITPYSNKSKLNL